MARYGCRPGILAKGAEMFGSVIPVVRHCMCLVLHEVRSHDTPTVPSCSPVMNYTAKGKTYAWYHGGFAWH